MDEAPSSSTSMRSTSDSGMVLRSTAEPTPEPEDSLTQRMPSTSTSTPLGPRWRRSTVAAPAPTPPPSGGKPKLPLELNLVLSAAPLAVRFWTTSATDLKPLRSMSSRLSTCTGTWVSSADCLMREPVTVTESSVMASGASWATAARGNEKGSAAQTATARRRRGGMAMELSWWLYAVPLPPCRRQPTCKQNVKRRQAPGFTPGCSALQHQAQPHRHQEHGEHPAQRRTADRVRQPRAPGRGQHRGHRDADRGRQIDVADRTGGQAARRGVEGVAEGAADRDRHAAGR